MCASQARCPGCAARSRTDRPAHRPREALSRTARAPRWRSRRAAWRQHRNGRAFHDPDWRERAGCRFRHWPVPMTSAPRKPFARDSGRAARAPPGRRASLGSPALPPRARAEPYAPRRRELKVAELRSAPVIGTHPEPGKHTVRNARAPGAIKRKGVPQDEPKLFIEGLAQEPPGTMQPGLHGCGRDVEVRCGLLDAQPFDVTHDEDEAEGVWQLVDGVFKQTANLRPRRRRLWIRCDAHPGKHDHVRVSLMSSLI